MRTNPQKTTDLFTFSKETLNEKLHAVLIVTLRKPLVNLAV